MPKQSPGADIPSLRREICALVAKNAVGMVQSTVDAVNEGGQYQAMKFLFEMVGLFPASLDEGDGEENSLSRILLESLGIREITDSEGSKKLTADKDLESE